jgi:hypothetical protein
MEKESKKVEIISEIYSRFTKENKENLIKTAASLLKVQKEDVATLVNTPPMKAKKQEKA